MDYHTREPLQNNHYEIAPDGSLLIVPIVRPLPEVIHEREIVAKYFGGGTMKVIAGICDLFKAELIFGDKGVSLADLEISINLQLQNKIDIYNTITAEQIINTYKLEQKKKEDRKSRKVEKQRPHSSTDRA